MHSEHEITFKIIHQKIGRKIIAAPFSIEHDTHIFDRIPQDVTNDVLKLKAMLIFIFATDPLRNQNYSYVCSMRNSLCRAFNMIEGIECEATDNPSEFLNMTSYFSFFNQAIPIPRNQLSSITDFLKLRLTVDDQNSCHLLRQNINFIINAIKTIYPTIETEMNQQGLRLQQS